MLGHAGADGRAFQEIKRLGAELARVGGEIAGARVPASVAVLHDWPSWWAGDGEARPSAHTDYPELLRRWHRALWEAGLTADFAQPEQPLDGYRLVVAPQLHLLSDGAAKSLAAFVRGGGSLVCGFFSGIVDEDDRVRPGGMHARLRELLGIRTLHEWWPLEPGVTVACDGPGGRPWHGELWSEELTAAEGAEAAAVYREGELAGLPAVLRNGRAWYLSTLPGPDALRTMLAEIAAGAGVRAVLPGLPNGVEAVRRGEVLFVLNHGTAPVTVPLPGDHRELLSDAAVTGRLALDRYGVAVLRTAAP
jgi:beta-galactosidase